MAIVPSVTAQIDEKEIFIVISNNFSKLAPYYYVMISNWLIRAYGVQNDIDKYLILLYLINKDLIIFRRNGLIVSYDTFYKDRSLEIDKINISDISKDLQIPKESVRRKIIELEKKNIIKKNGKKIFIDRSALSISNGKDTIKDISALLFEFNKILKNEKLGEKIFSIDQISYSIKENFSFCWYQFYKFIFVYTNRWRKEVKDLETMCIGILVMLNASENKSFKVKDLNLKTYQKKVMGSDERGVNAMSLSDITGIPRPTVVRKLKFLIKNNYITINEKKLLFINIQGTNLKRSSELQDANIKTLSNFIFKVFNQIKIIDSGKDKDDDFIPSYLR
ncbi:MarR family transcriptional regulator [Pelagibacterales bacterium SAG-MED22]|nr:MarR family transcriptional regulator [Pelagibacterales bacterium SAG-MED22]